MGLDISVFGNLKRVPEVCDERDDVRHLYSNDFPDQADAVVAGSYRCKKLMSFRAGSYSGYGEWRRQLSVLMLNLQPEIVWGDTDQYKDKPFFDLIHFSDCEGIIGPETSAKLAKNFEDWRHCTVNEGEYFKEKYECWAKAFKLAAENNGVVRFA